MAYLPCVACICARRDECWPRRWIPATMLPAPAGHLGLLSAHPLPPPTPWLRLPARPLCCPACIRSAGLPGGGEDQPSTIKFSAAHPLDADSFQPCLSHQPAMPRTLAVVHVGSASLPSLPVHHATLPCFSRHTAPLPHLRLLRSTTLLLCMPFFLHHFTSLTAAAYSHHDSHPPLLLPRTQAMGEEQICAVKITGQAS